MYGKQYAKYGVVVVRKLHSKCCRIVPAPPLDVVLVIAHVFPRLPSPRFAPRVHHAVYQRLHAAVVKAVSFVQINHVELVLCLCEYFHAKIEPLRVPSVLMSGFMIRSYSLS